jgi:hypothetical protein
MASFNQWRLSKAVQPTHYELELATDLEQFVFSGRVVRSSPELLTLEDYESIMNRFVQSHSSLSPPNTTGYCVECAGWRHL